jgi:hypothetical protein
MPNVGEAWYDISARTSKLRGALNDADSRVGGSVRNIEQGFGRRATGALTRLGGVARTVAKAGVFAAGFGVVALGALGGMAIKSAADMETMTVQWETLLGSTDAAKQRMQELREFAATTPFEIPEVMAASRTLQVFGGDAIATGDALTMVGDIAAGTQQPFGDVAMWVGRMYDAIKSGQPFGEAAMRLQEMGALSGENRRKIEELAEGVKDGTVTMDQAWKGTQGVFGQFSGLMEKQSQTVAGQWSNMMDNLGQTLVGIGEILLPFAKELIVGFNAALPTIREVLINVFEFAAPIIRNVASIIAKAVEFIIGAFTEAGDSSTGLGKFIASAFEIIRNVIATVAPFIGNLISFLATEVLPVLLEGFNAIAGWVSENWPMISSIIGNAIGLVIDMFKLLWPILETGARIVLPILGTAFEVLGPILNAMIEFLRGFIGFLTDPFMVTVETIGRSFSEVWEAVSGFFMAVWNGMLQAVGQIVGTMIGIIKNVVGVAAEIPGPWQEGAKEQKAALEEMEASAKTWGTETTATLETTYAEQRRLATTGATNTARAYADAFAAQGDYLAERVGYFGSKGSRLLETFSPPKYGPLKGIDKWGAHTADAYAEGFASRGENLRRIISGTLSGYAPRIGPGAASLSGAPSGIGGGSLTIQAHFESIVPYSEAQAQRAARAFVPALVPELRRQRVIR